MRIQNTYQCTQAEERINHIREIHKRSLADLRQHHKAHAADNPTATALCW